MDAGLAGSNYDLVKKTFDWATNDSKVRYVAILDEDDAVLFDHNPDELQVDTGALLQAGSTVRQGGLLRTSHPIEYDGERYGNVVLAYSLEEAMSEIWSETMLTVFINLLIWAWASGPSSGCLVASPGAFGASGTGPRPSATEIWTWRSRSRPTTRSGS
ncbi:hypothetical protein [Salinibacter ruber]|uniref:hypothetical protein n=1 Tax=Salinibacter ruber TaxID=146919 RepID=UPI00181C3DF2|nr:hypothetical protein [Salinibacter ruber]MBB4090819.1 hypothetical protein [Salinibacter ruber]